MRRNNKSFVVGSALGEQLADLAPFETSNAPTRIDGSLIASQDLPRTISGGVGSMVAGDVKADEPNEIARDMTLLADVVARRRSAGRSEINAQDLPDFFAADPSDRKDPAFTPIRMTMHGEDKVHVVDSIESAIECLTTLWPVRNGDAFEEALQTCIDGIKGRASPQQVRLAFVNAADEVGILILS